MRLRLPTLTPQLWLKPKQLMLSLVSRLGLGTAKSRLVSILLLQSLILSWSHYPEVLFHLSLEAPGLDSTSGRMLRYVPQSVPPRHTHKLLWEPYPICTLSKEINQRPCGSE